MPELSLPPLLVRADGGQDIGMGHIVRCLALAEAWRERGGGVVFRGRGFGESIRVRLETAGIRPVPLASIHPSPDDLRGTLAELSELTTVHDRAPCVLLDGYHFDATYSWALRDAGARLIVMDDTAPLDGVAPGAPALPSRTGDIVLNQNVGAEKVDYHDLDPTAVMLQGARYALLRREFLAAARAMQPYRERARHVLVAFGGSDPADLTRRVLGALSAADAGVQITAVIGPAYRNGAALQNMVGALGSHIAVRQDPDDVAELMSSATVAVTAGGSTCLEFAHLSVPMVLLQVADNQRGLAIGLERAGAAMNLGWHADVSDATLVEAIESLLGNGARRRTMGEAGRSLVDGDGCRRLLDVVNALDAPSLRDADVTIRRAAAEDARQIWRLANDPELRANSFGRPFIPLADHLRWYEKRLGDPNCLFLVMSIGGVVAAQVRYERDADRAEVHFAVAAAFRGKGLGTRALADTWGAACKQWDVRCIRGVVLRENFGSIRAFERAGYTRVGEADLRGFACHIFEKHCHEAKE